MSGHYLAERTCSVCGQTQMVTHGSWRPFVRMCRPCSSRTACKIMHAVNRSKGYTRPAPDPYTVDLILMGIPDGRIADNIEAMRRLPADLSAAEVARRLGVTERTVFRYRAELRRAVAA